MFDGLELPRRWWGTDVSQNDTIYAGGHSRPLFELPMLDSNWPTVRAMILSSIQISEGSLADTPDVQGKYVDPRRIDAIEADLGFLLPDAFRELMRTSNLANRIPNTGDNYLVLPQGIIRTTGKVHGAIFPFMANAHSGIVWHLLSCQIGSIVIAGPFRISRLLWDHPGQIDKLTAMRTKDRYVLDIRGEIPGFFVCATSFEEFLHRLWIEEGIKYAVVERTRELNLNEIDYINFFRNGRNLPPVYSLAEYLN
jgi:hypothetical protein